MMITIQYIIISEITSPYAEVWWSFEPYDEPVDKPLWDAKVIGARVFIDAGADGVIPDLIGDKGAVVTTQESECSWIFTTINTPKSGTQPFTVIDNLGWIKSLMEH